MTEDPLAEVRLYAGRHGLFVAGLPLATEGDLCRAELPRRMTEGSPPGELMLIGIGGGASGAPGRVIHSYCGQQWTPKALKWAAEEINRRAAEDE